MSNEASRKECLDHGLKGNKKGYSMIFTGGRAHARHRVVYCTSTGLQLSSIFGLVVRHKCDNPRCINPMHLEIGTTKDNAMDRVSRGRQHVVYGEKNPAAKISLSDVLEIRKVFALGKHTNKEIEKMFGCSRQHISLIVLRKIWVNT